MIYEKCRDILLKQSELIQNAVYVQEKIRTAVTNREWTIFEEHLNVMNSIESKMENLESEREQLFSVFEMLSHQQGFSDNLDAKGRFFKLTEILPEDERNDLIAIYTSLKQEAHKLRVENEALFAYLTEIKSTLNDFFALAFPQRCAKIYNKSGSHSSNDMSSMVLSRSF